MGTGAQSESWLSRLLRDGPELDAGSGPSRRAPAKSLLRDESGATMVMGVFMAAMLVGMIYYVWGIGGAVVHRERLQDAADTAAFGAAVIEARGMNLICVLNMIMLILAVIGTAMQIVPWIVGFAAAFATYDCVTTPCVFCACCPACIAAVNHGLNFLDALDDADDWEDRITNAMSAMNTAGHAVAQGAPIMAEALALAYGADTYRPTTDFGAALVPLIDGLEIENDDSGYVCGLIFEHWNFTSEHNFLSAASFFTAGTLAAATVFSMMATSTDTWFWRGFAIGLPLGYLVEHNTFCDVDGFLRVPEDSWLGEEEFQARTFMHGEPAWSWTTEGVAVANWGRTEGTESILGAIPPDIANSVSFAQSEYYWECDNGDVKEEWMFAPRWRARMRRFNAEGLAGSIPIVGGAMGVLDEFIIH